MNLETALLSCFVFGLVLTAVSFFGGASHLHLGHLHIGHAGGHGHGALHWFNGFSIAAFLCWFGGVGYLLAQAHTFGITVIFTLAAAAGLGAAALISLFLTRVLMKHERPLLPEDTEMRGVLARVSNTVRPGGTGEILFSLNGTRRCAAARTQAGVTLPRGTEVVVTQYGRGIAWITAFHAAETAHDPLHEQTHRRTV